MIETNALTKQYGDLPALVGVTFQVQRGDVVGLLGVNGAGKTTLLRILTAFMPATSGTAKVAGHDVFRESMAVRKKIGYLPESVPIYPELRVDEFLHFRARLKGIPASKRKTEIDRVVERCRIQDRTKQLVGTLSRGYRQRVGLADSLLGPPELLILDEPTSGLDPLQRLEVRELLKELRQDHTVLISTHILPEVEASCGRVLILHNGKLTPESEVQKLRTNKLFFISAIAPKTALLDSVRRLDSVQEVKASKGLASGAVEQEEAVHLEIEPSGKKDPRPDLVGLFHQKQNENWALLEMRRQVLTLEEIFSRITTSEEREAELQYAGKEEKGGSSTN